ncbi:MAG: hypothetical protein GY936_17590 [Ignavibacteriae bacterium]|nr:hypothetical protein [Ignavibacteriota bacterium]
MEIRSHINTFERERIDPNNLHGFIIEQSKKYTLLLNEYDFITDGFQIIRNIDITKKKISDSNKYCTKIMRKEGLISCISKPHINMESWNTIFRSLKNINKFVIVEDESEDIFLIGSISRVNQKSVSIRNFDGVGDWTGVENISYDDITSVSFDSRYILYHQKYIDTEQKDKG